MAYLVGFILALAVSVLARTAGLDRDRAFYPTVLIVVASYYVLFAAIGDFGRALFIESIVMTGFVIIAVVGFKRSVWLVVAGLAAHGVFDLLHLGLVDNPGVPAWWPAFCLSYDIGAAACLAWLSAGRSQPG